MTSNVQVKTSPLGGIASSRHVRIINTGAVTVFIEFGQSGVTASTTTSMPVVAGATEIFMSTEPYMAGITASGTAVVYATPGEGL